MDKALDLKNGSNQYPVHYSGSNTSGEKSFEEFFTEEETVDMDRLKSLGIVTGKELIDLDKVNVLFEELDAAFKKEDVQKDDIVKIIASYLPNFEHIEKGKSLDSKM